VVSSPWVDGASATAQTMEWLATSECTELSWCSTTDGHADQRTRTIWRSSPTKARSSSRCPWIYTCLRAA